MQLEKIFSTSLVLEEEDYIFTKGSGEVLKVGRSPVFLQEIWKIEQKNISSPSKFILKDTFFNVCTGYICFLSKSTSYVNTYPMHSAFSL